MFSREKLLLGENINKLAKCHYQIFDNYELKVEFENEFLAETKSPNFS